MEIKTITVDTDLGKIGMGDYIALQYQSEDEIGKVQGIIAGIDCRANPLDFRFTSCLGKIPLVDRKSVGKLRYFFAIIRR